MACKQCVGLDVDPTIHKLIGLQGDEVFTLS